MKPVCVTKPHTACCDPCSAYRLHDRLWDASSYSSPPLPPSSQLRSRCHTIRISPVTSHCFTDFICVRNERAIGKREEHGRYGRRDHTKAAKLQGRPIRSGQCGYGDLRQHECANAKHYNRIASTTASHLQFYTCALHLPHCTLEPRIIHVCYMMAARKRSFMLVT
jgi:hypothetical protein